jgi:acetone carboxylase gamma subunit
MTATIQMCPCGKVNHQKKKEWVIFRLMITMRADEFMKLMFQNSLTDLHIVKTLCPDCTRHLCVTLTTLPLGYSFL